MPDTYDSIGPRHPERTTAEQEAEARAQTIPGAPCPLCNGQGQVGGCKCGVWADSDTVDDILESLSFMRQTRKRWPPRRVIIDGRPGFIMARDMGFTQIATGVLPDGNPEWDWYCRSEYELA